MSDNINYEKVVEVAHADNASRVNEYLQLGWVLLNVESNQYSEHGWSTSYAIGWMKDGDVKHPGPTDLEKWANEKENDEKTPF